MNALDYDPVERERRHLESLLKDRQNFFFVFASVFLVGSYGLQGITSNERFVLLAVGTIVFTMLFIAVVRTHRLVEHLLSEIRNDSSHPYTKAYQEVTFPGDANVWLLWATLILLLLFVWLTIDAALHTTTITPLPTRDGHQVGALVPFLFGLISAIVIGSAWRSAVAPRLELGTPTSFSAVGETDSTYWVLPVSMRVLSTLNRDVALGVRARMTLMGENDKQWCWTCGWTRISGGKECEAGAFLVEPPRFTGEVHQHYGDTIVLFVQEGNGRECRPAFAAQNAVSLEEKQYRAEVTVEYAGRREVAELDLKNDDKDGLKVTCATICTHDRFSGS